MFVTFIILNSSVHISSNGYSNYCTLVVTYLIWFLSLQTFFKDKLWCFTLTQCGKTRRSLLSSITEKKIVILTIYICTYLVISLDTKSKNVIFTKFLPKKSENNFPHSALWKNEKFTATQIFFCQISLVKSWFDGIFAIKS